MKRLLFLLCLIGLPGPVSSQSLEKYYVSGMTTKQLSASIRQLGPRNATGATRIRLGYSYTRSRSNGISRAIKPVVTRDVVFRMPYWRGYPNASECMKRSWTAMYASLARHEIKHMQISEGVPAQIEAAILSVPPQKSDRVLQDMVKKAVGKVLKAHNAAQAKFDRETKHGMEDPADPILFKHCR
jgi:predicted secreted Zn-dependent protease